MATVQRISPCLWFDSEAEQAARFYTGIFKNSRIGTITRYGKAGFEIHQRPAGYYWEKLTAGGDPKAQQCGWLKDKYGLSW